MTRIVTDIRPLLNKIEAAYVDALDSAEADARRNLGSSRMDAVTSKYKGRMKWTLQSNVPYGLIRQWGGVIRPRNREGYLHFRTRDGNWVKTKASRQKGNRWLSRAALGFGKHMTRELVRRG